MPTESVCLRMCDFFLVDTARSTVNFWGYFAFRVPGKFSLKIAIFFSKSQLIFHNIFCLRLLRLSNSELLKISLHIIFLFIISSPSLHLMSDIVD